MHRDGSHHSLLGTRQVLIIQQHKMKSILFIASAAVCCLFTLTLATATPVTSEATNTHIFVNVSTTAAPQPAVGHLNGSKLVITNVVKTLEFEVELQEEDGNNSTEALTDDGSTTKIIETDIEVLNPSLLQEVIEEHISSSKSPLAIDGTKSNEDDDDDLD